MLELRNVMAGYGAGAVLQGLSLTVRRGEVVCLLGRNGAGKTTALKTVMGLLPLQAGAVLLDGQRLSGLPAWRIARCGIGYVPQGRRLFPELTVAENLHVAMMTGRGGDAARARALQFFPQLQGRLQRRADSLSGGERQMAALARALCVDPLLLLLDEPTEGLQPALTARIGAVVNYLKTQGVAVLLVEQRIEPALAVADRLLFIEGGRLQAESPAAGLSPSDPLFARYLGV